MAKQPQSFFLEEWLRSVIFISSSKNAPLHSSTSSQAIIQAWANLRDSLQHKSFNHNHIQSLKILVSSQASLHVADPQAKLLLSILSSQEPSLPHDSYPFFLRLLYIWLRKSRHSSLAVDNGIEILLNLFSKQSNSNESVLFFSEGILLLGALSFESSASEKSKRACLELLCKLLEEKYGFISSSDELASNALAGAGYALSSSLTVYFGRILYILLSVWSQGRSSGSISQCLMLLHLVEWVLSNALNLRSLDNIDRVGELLGNVKPSHSSTAVVMTAAGVLRASNRSGTSGFLHLKNCAEDCIEVVARDLITPANGFESGNDFLLQCIALALARTGSVSYRPYLFLCLAHALLTEIFPLKNVFNKVLNFPEENLVMVLDEIKQHINSVIFKEAGAVTGVFCNMYATANEDSRIIVENLIWDYCQEVYLLHRQTKLVLLGKGDNIIKEMEKIAESAFLMVVVFALGVTKHEFDSRILINQETRLQSSVRILVSFSCMEYFRRMRLPEYMDTIRVVITSLQENESACISFAESIPSYDDLTINKGSYSLPKVGYLWATDEVQTARVVFYMRVIPACIERIPASIFEKVIAPTMFLYMGHPNSKVARYSHSVFVAFVSSGKDPISEERVLLKEKLVFYYVQRSLEGYPEITPFEGMASGVAAIVRHLPAGSPSTFYCIHCLAEKANILSNHDTDQRGNWDGESEPFNKLLDLLLRLLTLVDIQVLPSLMKLLAQVIVKLPVESRNIALNQLYQEIAESDDVTRKPTLISWVQSLSYLCSQGTRTKQPQLVGEAASSRSMSSLSFNVVNARL